MLAAAIGLALIDTNTLDVVFKLITCIVFQLLDNLIVQPIARFRDRQHQVLSRCSYSHHQPLLCEEFPGYFDGAGSTQLVDYDGGWIGICRFVTITLSKSVPLSDAK